MKMKCLVIDDEPLARKGLEEFIDQTPFLEHSGSFSSAIGALKFLKQNTMDILFLDIQMPDMTGIEFMKALANPPQVLFTTAHREFALEGFELNVVDFLLKPFSYSRFLRGVQKTIAISDLAKQNEASDNHIFIKCDGMIIKVFIDAITFVETAKDYVKIHTIDDTYLTLISLKRIEKELPKEKFIRVHRYYLVAYRYIDKLEGNRIYVAGNQINMSRALREQVYQAIVGSKLIERP